MSIVQEENTVDQPVTGKPGRKAIARYRQSVYDGQCDEEVLFQARRIRPEFDADCQTYQRRVEACRVITEEVPRLESAAAEARKALADAEPFTRSEIPGDTTVEMLRAKIPAELRAKIPTGTPAELGAALQFLAMPGGHVGNLKSKLIQAEAAVRNTRSGAEQTLRQTAADHRPDPELTKLGAKIVELEGRIASRRDVLTAEEKVPAVREECEALGSGRTPPTFSSIIGQPPTPLKTLYQRARETLDRLFDLVAKKPDAEKANAADQAELSRLQASAAEIHHKALERLADAKAMKWTGDE